MDRHFDEELKNLKKMLIDMSSTVQEMIRMSISGLKERKESLLDKVVEQEESVNMTQIEIDDIALKLIALRQPAASDLRLIVSAIKINSELERIADLATNIVERARVLLKDSPLKPLIDLPRMAEISQRMLQDATESFIKKDTSLAIAICKRDDSVDDLNEQVFRELLTYMLQDPKNINRTLELMLVARYLERIADLATNIAEDVIYMVEGKDIRHHVENSQRN